MKRANNTYLKEEGKLSAQALVHKSFPLPVGQESIGTKKWFKSDTKIA